jgi:prepilin-type N-terminal cleavage/methylation domain-containing protein
MLNQKGYTLIEMAIATLLLGIMATTVVLGNRFLNKQSVVNSDQTFATEKAIQMYEELRALVNGNEQLGVGVLDNYSNGSNFDTVLTTDTNVDIGTTANPGDPLSGNIKSDGNWRYIRQVEVNRLANDPYARQVTVKVYLYPGDFAVSSTNKPGTLLATVGGILRTSAQPYSPTQVMDMYILAVNNIPAWWAVLPTLGGYMQNAILDLTNRIPQLQIRAHYVTRSSYGRDYYYQPETNSSANGTEVTPQQWAYFYPGYVPQWIVNSSNVTVSGGSDYFYYDPTASGDQNSLLLTGNFMVDGTSYPISSSQFGSGNSPQVVNYPVADQYNNAMRYPDELMAYKAVTTAAASYLAGGGILPEGVTEVSERMLMEGMLSQPQSFANAMIVNLHGELLPLPPLRNYSDAAKDPGNQLVNIAGQTQCPITVVSTRGITAIGNTNVRVVTHPELLYYPGQTSTSSSVTVRLRVYAYYDSENMGGSAGLPSGDPRVPAVSLYFPDAAVSLAGVTVEIGNGLTTGVTCHYSKVGLTGLTSPGNFVVPGDVTAANASGPMSIKLSYVGSGGKQTLIQLFNTPLRCAMGPDSGGSGSSTFGGLNAGDMLYGSEYVPCSPDLTTANAPTSAAYVNNSVTFTNQDLANPSANASGNPNNTARWIISLVMPVTQAYTTPVTLYNQPYNTNVIYPSGQTFVGQHTIETYIGAGVTMIPSYTAAGIPVTIYPDLSRTYVWCGTTTPPYTEQYQFMGDPRDCPYLDVKVGGPSTSGATTTIGPNAYNWWFKNGNTGEMASDGYAGFNASGNNNNWNGNGVGIDIPRYYQILRQGLLNTTSIWTTTNGWSFYYYGIGGEIGFDHSPMTTGVQILSYPFQKTATGAVTNGYDSINGDGRNGTSPVTGLWVASNVTGSSSVTWYQRSWLGELYPDDMYVTCWSQYGNLPTVKPVKSFPETFYLNTMQNVNDAGGGGNSDDGFNGNTFFPNPAGNGCESFFNGTTSGGYLLQHDGGGNGTGTEQTIGVTTYNIYPFPLAESVSVQRPWYFGGGTPPEWSDAPYNTTSMRPTLDNPSTLADGTASETRIFYNYSGSTTEYGSGLIRMTLANAGTTQIGYVVETGTAPSGSVGAQTLAETALIYAMRTFLDGGQMAATNKAGHIVQIPLVKIFPSSVVPQYNENQTIAVTIASPVTATTNGEGAVSVGYPVTDVWWRFNSNGLANYYTEEYPNYGAAMTGTGMYSESVSVIYNLKYSPNAGVTWAFVQDGSAAVSGVCDTSAAHAVTNIAPWTYNWPVASGGTTLAQGDYLMMVEAYRQNHALHYAYDIYDFAISW